MISSLDNTVYFRGAPQVVPVVKNPHVNAGGDKDWGSIPGLRRSPGGGHGNPLYYSYLEKIFCLWEKVELIE